MTPDVGPYKVLYENVKKSLTEIRDKALMAGVAEDLLNTFRLLDESLQKDPLAFGDPMRSKGDVHILHRLLPPLNITYSVHIGLKLVYLQTVSVYPEDTF